MADRCSLLQSRSVFWEALEKCEAACPCPVTLILYWGAAGCLHYPPKFKMLPVLFSRERQSSYLRLCLVSWPVPMQDLLPPAEVSKSWVKASLRASSWSPEHKEGPRCVSPERSSPRDRDVFLEQYAFRDASLRPTACQRWDSHFRHRPVSLLIDTYSCQPSLGLGCSRGLS